MNYTKTTNLIVIFCIFIAQMSVTTANQPPENTIYDIVVYGDSSGGVTAAIAAKRLGHSVILVNPTNFPGGMSSSGLGATDFLGKRNTFGGIASEFYDGIAKYYNKDHVRSFEPHVGQKVFGQIKDNRGIDKFMRRGFEACRSEWSLICATHNLLKLWRSGKAC